MLDICEDLVREVAKRCAESGVEDDLLLVRNNATHIKYRVGEGRGELTHPGERWGQGGVMPTCWPPRTLTSLSLCPLDSSLRRATSSPSMRTTSVSHQTWSR